MLGPLGRFELVGNAAYRMLPIERDVPGGRAAISALERPRSRTTADAESVFAVAGREDIGNVNFSYGIVVGTVMGTVDQVGVSDGKTEADGMSVNALS